MTQTMKSLFQDTETQSVVRNGFLGVIGSATSFTISKLELLEAWLRVSSLIIGIVVSLASLTYIILKIIKLTRVKHK